MLHPGDLVDRFEVVERLGAGGIAEVYKARHRVLGSFHALKIVTAGGPTVARRLLREGSIQAQLRHPNVVTVTDVLEVDGHTALVLEYVEGVTLQGFLAERGALGLDEALALFAQVLAGVAAAHGAGVLHRDLKPANVLLAPGPAGVTAKVADFGLAKVLVDDGPVTPGETMHGLAMGTPGYMAPEQIGDAGTADARADVFALGVVLYEMLSGEQPFGAETMTATLRNTLRGDHVTLSSLRPDLPPHVLDTVARCLAPDRGDRYADAHGIARALYGDRPELAEVVAGSRTGAPLALSLPSVIVLRPGGLGSATTPANPTLGPGALDSLPGTGPGATLSFDGVASSPVEPPVAPPVPRAAPSRRWFLAGFGLFASGALALAFVLRLPGGEELQGGVAEPAARARAPATTAAAPPVDAAPVEAAAVEAGGEGAATVEAAAPEAVGGRAAGGLTAGGEAEPLGGSASKAAAAEPASVEKGSAEPVSTANAPGGAGIAAIEEGAVASVDDAEPAREARAEPPSFAPAPLAPAEPPASAPDLTGQWKGSWDGRPFTLTLSSAGPDQLEGRLEVLVGAGYRTFRLSGPIAADGRFALSEVPGPGWWIDGVLDQGALVGSIRHPDAKKATGYAAKRR